jgi:hypothetical protein
LITRAAERLAAGDDAGALTDLLEAWRLAKAPALADAIDRVSARITRPAITGGTKILREKAWHTVAKAGDPADVPRLVDAPWPGRWEDAMPRLRRLVAWPDDPRVAMALAREVDATRYVSRSASRFYEPLFRRLETLADARTLPLLEAQLERRKPPGYAMAPREQKLVALLRALPSLHAEVAEIDRALRAPGRSGGDPLAPVYDDPENLEVRRVVGDGLVERGDPRGDLIALQLAPAPDERKIARLISRHRAALAGPLDAVFEDEGRRYEGGFLAAGIVPRLRRPEELEKTLDLPEWRAVREIELSRPDEALPRLLTRKDLHLRGVHNVFRRWMVDLLAGPPRSYESISFHAHTPEPSFADCRALPALRRLGLTANPDDELTWLTKGALWRRLEACTLAQGIEVLPRWLGRLDREAQPTLRAFRIIAHGARILAPIAWLCDLARDPSGRFADARIEWRPVGIAMSSFDIEILASALETIAPGRLSSLAIAFSGRERITNVDRDRLRGATARLRCAVTLPW